jgi:hypothetical protein
MISTIQTRPTFLSDEQLHKLAPSIFAEAPHASRSDRYSHIPTSHVIDSLRREGFQPVRVQTSRVRRDDRRGFEKHMIRFRQLDVAVAVDDVVPEIALVNAHDGSAAYSLSAGLFRLVCANGLVVVEKDFGAVTIRHQGIESVREVIDESRRVLDQAIAGISVAKRWRQIELSPDEQTTLATTAHQARFADATGRVTTPITPRQLLLARRPEDDASDLWTTYNRIQENVMKGGIGGVRTMPNGRPRRVTTRAVGSIDQTLTLNRDLWAMALQLEAAKSVN